MTLLIATYTALVLAVHDGDTFRTRVTVWPGETLVTSVRILGIDAPELGSRAKCPQEQALAVAARGALSDLLLNQSVFLTHVTPDKFGTRVLADVATADGLDIAGELLKRGLVVSYDGHGPKHQWCS